MADHARMRLSRVALVPVVFLAVCVLPFAAAAPWAAVVLVVPLLAAVWVLRVGVDVDDEGITTHTLGPSRRVAWTELAGIRVGRGARLRLVTTAGSELQLPVLRARDLPRLAALSGGRIDAP
ncbi:PH domain-containing protein [Geodermatophilus dictyosporus]|uniref:PH domain-containing protein n=1 Tax=Geodermatophilus dictyosporus TaxID=1523247 RepID=A0A1I5KU98_9ACTN|nr:PH domain-containing protein [Geodermatophilus dictyosporus]SFO88196.1 PH domain-containing protein [Geodermatophilus dictyosporus]